MKKLIALGLALILVAALLAGCNGDSSNANENDLVGTWYWLGMEMYTFNADGTGLSGGFAEIEWSVRGNRLSIDFEGEVMEVNFTYEDGTLTLTDDDDFEMIMTRDPDDDPFGGGGEGGWTPPADPDEDMAEYMGEIIEGWDELMLLDSALEESNFKTHTFIDYIEGSRGIISQAATGAQPHMMVLIELPEGVSAAEVAADIEENNDPAVWICVAAEVVDIFYAGQYVLMVMTLEEWNRPSFEANFNALFG